jgi:hypothetical protein
MRNALIPAAMLLLLSGCGLADLGAAGATSGASAAEQARQAKQTEAQVKQQVDAAVNQEAERVKAAETASQ